MSIGYHAPVPPFTGGFSAGEVRDNLPVAIALADKTRVGLTADLRPVYRLEVDIQWTDVESATDQYGRWIGTEAKTKRLPAGSLVTDNGRLTDRTIWTDLASVEHNAPDAGDLPPPADDEWDRLRKERRVLASFAARWVVENVDRPGNCQSMDDWYDLICIVAAPLEAPRGMWKGAGSPYRAAQEALERYESREADAAKAAKESATKAAEEAARLAASPFAVLAGLR